MAGSTILAQAQKGILPLFQFRFIDEIRNVALAAVDPAVGPGQFISCKAVVEIPFIEPGHIEIPAVVFAVAFGTVFTPDIAGSMVTRPAADKAPDFFMAIQALIIGNLFPKGMTLRTIRYSFQVGVRSGQGPRRQLCLQAGKEQRIH